LAKLYNIAGDRVNIAVGGIARRRTPRTTFGLDNRGNVDIAWIHNWSGGQGAGCRTFGSTLSIDGSQHEYQGGHGKLHNKACPRALAVETVTVSDEELANELRRLQQQWAQPLAPAFST
jgi:hypothetical protein